MTVAAALDTKLFQKAAKWLLWILSGIMVYHFVVVRSWGIGTFECFDRHIQEMGKRGDFIGTPFIDADGSPSFARYAHSPVGRWLHIFPAGLWSVIAPIQLSRTLRSKYRAAHRYTGRIFILMSFAIGVGLPFLIYSGATKIHAGPAGFGQFKKAVGFTVVDVYFVATAMLAIREARQKRYASHRVWILRHVATGYGVHTFRLMLLGTGKFIVNFVPDYEAATQAGSDVRDTVFQGYLAVAFALSTGCTEMWIRHTKRLSGAATMKQKTN